MTPLVFKTDQGRIVPAVSRAQMREIDRISLEEKGPNLFQMMENAGRNLARLALEKLGPNWRQARILVLAGPGGNGGGGICAGRHLANRGISVSLCLSAPDRMREVTVFQKKIFLSAGGILSPIETIEALQPALILDALIGYSLSGPPRSLAKELILRANQSAAPILSLDLPSGLEADSGDAPGERIRPQWTLTLALPKTGLQPEKTGALFLGDIGLSASVYKRIGLPYENPFGRGFIIPLHAIPKSAP